MKLKLIAALLLSLFAGSAFAQSYHDDEAPQPPVEQEAKTDAKAQAPKPKHSHEAAKTQDNAATETSATLPAAEPNKAHEQTAEPDPRL